MAKARSHPFDPIEYIPVSLTPDQIQAVATDIPVNLSLVAKPPTNQRRALDAGDWVNIAYVGENVDSITEVVDNNGTPAHTTKYFTDSPCIQGTKLLIGGDGKHSVRNVTVHLTSGKVVGSVVIVAYSRGGGVSAAITVKKT